MGNKEGIAYSLGGLANADSLLGRIEEAKSLWERSLALHEELGDTRSVALTLHNLSDAAWKLDDLEGARQLSGQSVQLLDELQDRPMMVEALRNLAQIASRSSGHSHVARLLGAAEAMSEVVGASAADDPPETSAAGASIASTARATLGDDAFESMWWEGRRMSPEEATEYARERANLQTLEASHPDASR